MRVQVIHQLLHEIEREPEWIEREDFAQVHVAGSGQRSKWVELHQSSLDISPHCFEWNICCTVIGNDTSNFIYILHSIAALVEA